MLTRFRGIAAVGLPHFLTSAAARGASLFKMMDVSRHKSVDVLRSYSRDADAFRDHAGALLPRRLPQRRRLPRMQCSRSRSR
jgi:hypothetical protein